MDLRKKAFLKVSLISLLFLGLLVAWLGFGERGFIHLYRMEQERQAHMERIQRLEDENKRLLDEIHRLRTDREHIESMAREDLGLVKEDEILYRFSKNPDVRTQTGKKGH